MAQIDPRAMRDTLGRFCTGVVLVTGGPAGRPAGFAAQSFVSVSLDPPLVAVCPARTSRSWPLIRDAGRFCINVLAADQKPLCDGFARSGADKFAGVAWRSGVTGAPIVDDVLAFVDCELEAEHDAGDHTIAVGRVCDLGIFDDPRAPLLFFGGAYGSFADLDD